MNGSINESRDLDKDRDVDMDNIEKIVVEKDMPEQLMSLKELGEKSKEELLGVVNQMGKVNNKSSINVMNKHGYDFTFSQLETVAQFCGFEKDSGTSREVHYVAEDIEEILPDKEEILELEYEIFKSAKKKDKSDIARTPIFIFKKDGEKFKKIVEENSSFGLKEVAQAVIFRRMLEGKGIK